MGAPCEARLCQEHHIIIRGFGGVKERLVRGVFQQGRFEDGVLSTVVFLKCKEGSKLRACCEALRTSEDSPRLY